MSDGHGPWCPHGEEYRCERCIKEEADSLAIQLQEEQTAAVLLAAVVRREGTKHAAGWIPDVIALARKLREELDR
jgi:hypothetical protein